MTPTDTTVSVAAPAAHAQRPHRRWPRPRFSLRMLLLAMTLFAIAFPVWYVWPYTEREVHYPFDPNGKPDKTKAPDVMIETQMKRVLGGKPVKHGMRVIRSGDREEHETRSEFRNDVQHGEHVFSKDGKTIRRGQFVQGQKSGQWSETRDDWTITHHWSQDKLDGVTRVERADGTRDEFEFEIGILVRHNDEVIRSPLLERMKRQELDEKLDVALQQTFSGDINRSLSDSVSILHELGEVPIVLDAKIITNLDYRTQKLSIRTSGTNIAGALVLIAQAAGAECDYRYGLLWVTTKEDAAGWRDLTGIEELVMRPDSALANHWESKVQVATIAQPLHVVLDDLLRPLSIPFDTSAIQPQNGEAPLFLVSVNLREISLKNMLGVLLSQTGCRCKLDDRQMLVVLPPEDQAAD